MSDFPPTVPQQPDQGGRPPSGPEPDQRESHWIRTVAIVCVIGLAAVLFWPGDKPPTDMEAGPPQVEAPADEEPDGHGAPEEKFAVMPDQPAAADVTEDVGNDIAEHEEEMETPEESTPSAEPMQPEAPAPRFASPPVGSGDVFVQVGSFARPENARALSDRLSPTWPLRIVPTATGWHRVQVGPFASRDAATEALAALKEQYGLDGFIAGHD